MRGKRVLVNMCKSPWPFHPTSLTSLATPVWTRSRRNFMTLQLASRWSRLVAAMAHWRMGIITWLRSRVTGLRWMNLREERTDAHGSHSKHGGLQREQADWLTARPSLEKPLLTDWPAGPCFLALSCHFPAPILNPHFLAGLPSQSATASPLPTALLTHSPATAQVALLSQGDKVTLCANCLSSSHQESRIQTTSQTPSQLVPQPKCLQQGWRALSQRQVQPVEPDKLHPQSTAAASLPPP